MADSRPQLDLFPWAVERDPAHASPPSEPDDKGFQKLYDALEKTYLCLQRTMMYGEKFRAKWQKARHEICKEHGWKELDFDAELTRRMRQRASSHRSK